MIADNKIVTNDWVGNDVESMPDQPSLDGWSAATVKQGFDKASKNVVAPKHNGLIDSLAAQSAAAEIGSAGGTVQADIDSLKTGDANSVKWDDVQQTLVAAEDEVPSGKAVADALGSAGYGDMLKAVYDPDNDGVVKKADDAEKLGGEPPASYMMKSLYDKDGSGVVDDAEKLGGKEPAEYMLKSGATAIIQVGITSNVSIVAEQTISPVPFNVVRINDTGLPNASVLSGGQIVVPAGYSRAVVMGGIGLTLSAADASAAQAINCYILKNGTGVVRSGASLVWPNTQMQNAVQVAQNDKISMSIKYAGPGVQSNSIFNEGAMTFLTVMLFA